MQYFKQAKTFVIDIHKSSKLHLTKFRVIQLVELLSISFVHFVIKA